jgi:hypothetical protein
MATGWAQEGEYHDIEETVAPVAPDTMSAWITRHVARL